MSEVDVVKKALVQIEFSDSEGPRVLLSGRFEFSAAVPEPVGTVGRLGTQTKVLTSFSAFAFRSSSNILTPLWKRTLR